MTGPYRTLGSVDCPPPPATSYEVIVRAKEIRDQRHVAELGPKPAWWRTYARMAWLERQEEYRFRLPSVQDVERACRELRATVDVENQVLEALIEIQMRNLGITSRPWRLGF